MFKRRVLEALGVPWRVESAATKLDVRPRKISSAQMASQSARKLPPLASQKILPYPPPVPDVRADVSSLRELHSLVRRMLERQAVASTRREKELLEGLAVLQGLLEEQLPQVAATHTQLRDRFEQRLSELATGQARIEERLGLWLSQWEELRTEWDRRLGGLAQELQAVRSAIRPPVVVSPSGVVVVEVDGFLVAVPAEDWSMAGRLAIWGAVERGLILCFGKLVKAGMTVIDIGANVGIYTLHAARLTGPGGSVFSFEPCPRVFPTLRQNIVANGFTEWGSVHCAQMAVTDQAGVLNLYCQEAMSSHSTLFPLKAEGEQRIAVNSAALDDLIPVETKVDVIKMDAEGSEPLIWRGMDRIIRDNPSVVILMEFAPSHLSRAGAAPETFLDELEGRGFQIERVEPYNGEVQPVTRQFLAGCHSENLYLRRA